MNKNVRNKLYNDPRIPLIMQDIANIQTEITNIQTDITNLQNNITTINSEITTINSTLITINTEISTINTTLTTIQGDITTINATLSGLTSYENTSLNIPINSPALFGNITVHFARIGKLVNCVIEPATYDFTGSPQNQISTLGGEISASYRPVGNVLYLMIFKSNGVYDTGLVGNCIVSSAGALLFSRDNDAAPLDFDGISGWSWSISLSWVTA